MMVLFAALLLAQEPHRAPPVPDARHPAVTEHGATAGHEQPEAKGEHEGGDIAGHIFHHVEDEVVVPWNFYLGRRHIDISITKHVINMWIAAGILLIVVALATRKRALIPKGGYNLLETFVLFVRDEVSAKNIGEHANLYTPYLCSAFFFILFMNLCGLLPIPSFGGFPGISTATGNISVTMVLALFTFTITQIAGMRAQGVIGYWIHLVPAGVPAWLWPLMLPVEILGLFTKPFALTVRLFANMVAGHIVIFFLIALTIFLSVYVAPVSVLFALGIFMLELFVGLVQAYVFTMLSAVFIGMTQHAH
ncbi:MAG: F0F1 ATP synthase subunit A [Deltaproteobacteria bacterium]|nr:MAG: F0F1 ATP synthase subunit A [Deltaproteobacteria bacterium]